MLKRLQRANQVSSSFQNAVMKDEFLLEASLAAQADAEEQTARQHLLTLSWSQTPLAVLFRGNTTLTTKSAPTRFQSLWQSLGKWQTEVSFMTQSKTFRILWPIFQRPSPCTGWLLRSSLLSLQLPKKTAPTSLLWLSFLSSSLTDLDLTPPPSLSHASLGHFNVPRPSKAKKSRQRQTSSHTGMAGP